MLENNLYRLFYGSTATEQYSPAEIGNILAACRQNNAALNITGMLFYGENHHFLQCLEGSRSNINTLYKKILMDQRHTKVEILDFREVTHRYFEDWTMKYVRSTAIISKILKETGLKEFNPYLLDRFSLDALLEAFRSAEESSMSTTYSFKESSTKKKSSAFDLMKFFKTA